MKWMIDPLTLFKTSLDTLLAARSLTGTNYVVEHPRDLTHGDVATNIALTVCQRWADAPQQPRSCADELCQLLNADVELQKVFEPFSVAGPGFINGSLRPAWLESSLNEAVHDQNFGQTYGQKGKSILIEFTDPNPFKEFHIGHLMSNSIGEAMARLQEWTGATVERLCYQGDVGMHIAKAVWGLSQLADDESLTLETIAARPLAERVLFMGRAYALGARNYETAAKSTIDALNSAIYARDDEMVNEWYDAGRAWSLEYFEGIYARLGTKFTKYYFESETGEKGLETVKEFLAKGVFKESDGAVIFAGEEYGLHSRVFINAKGLPTYETKEIGLALAKAADYPPADLSVVVTGNEVADYFKVVQKALSLINPDLAAKTLHRPHGMLRLTTGKMSSRTGEVIVATTLLDDLAEAAVGRMTDADTTIADQVGIAAIKYAVLKTTVGKDIIYDPDGSLAFEGNTGPYLQYTYARTVSVLRKAGAATAKSDEGELTAGETAVLRQLYRFPEVVKQAAAEYAPSNLCTYLFELASRYNELYAQEKIVGGKRQTALIQLTKAVGITIKNGLTILGIPVPDRL